ncbi:MAG TPA: hypothetical protein DEO85_03790 [Maritimibacter sp.]|nr:hypothetical protein [Maritimibacter sp.]
MPPVRFQSLEHVIRCLIPRFDGAILSKEWKPVPVIDQMRDLLCDAVGRQVRRTPPCGLRWP